MINDLNSALGYLADRSNYNTQIVRQDQLQRRNQVVDLYGVEFTRQGDAQTPARFYISISQDMQYLERFEFKLAIQPFAMSVGNNGSTANTSLTASTTVAGTSLTTNGTTINPNPHTHTASTTISPNSHNHALNAGITLTQSTASNFRVYIEDIEITSYLQQQYPNWISGEGVYPNGKSNDKYDILGVVGLLYPWQRGVITSPGFKEITISANNVFSASLTLYLKLPHMNR